jgi:hypothetical protein
VAFSFVSKSLLPLWCSGNKEIRYASLRYDVENRLKVIPQFCIAHFYCAHLITYNFIHYTYTVLKKSFYDNFMLLQNIFGYILQRITLKSMFSKKAYKSVATIACKNCWDKQFIGPLPPVTIVLAPPPSPLCNVVKTILRSWLIKYYVFNIVNGEGGTHVKKITKMWRCHYFCTRL